MNTIRVSGIYDVGGNFNYEIRPSDISKGLRFIGEDMRAIDGTNNRFKRALKKSWKFSFNGILKETTEVLDLVFLGASEFVYTDEDNQSYTVFTDINSYNKQLSATNVSLSNVVRYNLSFNLEEV
jgi:hypothetical protein